MVAANGVPVRLVHDNGRLTEINATSMTLTTERKTGGMPTPFTGGRRVGVDLNMNKGLILMEGVLTDDRELVGSHVAASSTMDFSFIVTDNAIVPFLSAGNSSANYNIARIFDNSYTSGSDEFSHTTLILTSTDSTSFTIKFKKLSSGAFTNTTNTDYTIGINPTGSLTAALFATAVSDLINNSTTISDKFTATTSTSPVTGTSGALLTITQDSTGEDGNNSTPFFDNRTNMIPPQTVTFKGGLTVSKKSAGDKAMDLYGIMNNSKKSGFGKAAIGAGMFVGGVALSFTGVGAPIGAGVAAAGAGIALDGAGFGSDYIVGIQIPYNSTIQAGTDNFVARNFIMPTGWGVSGKEKGSEGNDNPAGVTFDGNRTGIKGTLKKLDINYNAGENVYLITLLFVPVDNLL
jgi:hypothetical protein